MEKKKIKTPLLGSWVARNKKSPQKKRLMEKSCFLGV